MLADPPEVGLRLEEDLADVLDVVGRGHGVAQMLRVRRRLYCGEAEDAAGYEEGGDDCGEEGRGMGH